MGELRRPRLNSSKSTRVLLLAVNLEQNVTTAI